jgi:hypothetical protein
VFELALVAVLVLKLLMAAAAVASQFKPVIALGRFKPEVVPPMRVAIVPPTPHACRAAIGTVLRIAHPQPLSKQLAPCYVSAVAVVVHVAIARRDGSH